MRIVFHSASCCAVAGRVAKAEAGRTRTIAFDVSISAPAASRIRVVDRNLGTSVRLMGGPAARVEAGRESRSTPGPMKTRAPVSDAVISGNRTEDALPMSSTTWYPPTVEGERLPVTSLRASPLRRRPTSPRTVASLAARGAFDSFR